MQKLTISFRSANSLTRKSVAKTHSVLSKVNEVLHSLLGIMSPRPASSALRACPELLPLG